MNNIEKRISNGKQEEMDLKTKTEWTQVDLIDSMNGQDTPIELKLNQEEINWIQEDDMELEKIIEKELSDDKRDKINVEQLKGSEKKISLGLFNFIQSICKSKFKKINNWENEFPVRNQTLDSIKCHQHALETLKIIYIVAKKDFVVDSEIIRITRRQLGVKSEVNEDKKEEKIEGKEKERKKPKSALDKDIEKKDKIHKHLPPEAKTRILHQD